MNATTKLENHCLSSENNTNGKINNSPSNDFMAAKSTLIALYGHWAYLLYV